MRDLVERASRCAFCPFDDDPFDDRPDGHGDDD
jgi:hypothetical protein